MAEKGHTKNEKSKTGYHDGGFTKNGDNLPFFPLLKMGYKNFIVIHLDDKEYIPNEDLSGCRMYHIFPSKSLNGAWGTLDFTPKSIKKKQELGRDDVAYDYNYREALKQMFSEQSNRELHYTHGTIYTSLEEMYKYKTVNVNNEKELGNALKKDCTEIEIRNQKMITFIERIRRLDKKQIAIVFSCLVAFISLEIGSSGIATPAAVVTLAPATAVVGHSAIRSIISLVRGFGSADALKKFRAYSLKKKADGSIILHKKAYGEKKEVADNLKEFIENYRNI